MNPRPTIPVACVQRNAAGWDASDEVGKVLAPTTIEPSELTPLAVLQSQPDHSGRLGPSERFLLEIDQRRAVADDHRPIRVHAQGQTGERIRKGAEGDDAVRRPPERILGIRAI
jgi:hypothetical protein